MIPQAYLISCLIMSILTTNYISHALLIVLNSILLLLSMSHGEPSHYVGGVKEGVQLDDHLTKILALIR